MKTFRLATLIGCALIVAQSLSNAEQTQVYDGAAQLVSLDQLTVVYPSADADGATINRGTADRVAAYFALRHGVVTGISSDLEVSETQLDGHLLLLGWQNRLFDDPRAARPFTRDESGFHFLEGIGGGTAADLLFIHPSPFNQDKFLAFWSRIDSERDKLWGFPFSGSDWVIYTDYHSTKLGMLADTMAWPPQRNLQAEKHGEYTLPPFKQASAHYRLHHAISSLDETQTQSILASREAALLKAISHLGDPGEGFMIDLYVYADAETKQRQTGVSDPVHSLPRSGELHTVLSHARTTNPQNDTHLLAHARLGPNTLSALYQGLPLALKTEDKPGEQETLAALLMESQNFPAVAELLDDEKLRMLATKGLAFRGSQLLVAWIRHRAGDDGLKRAYQLTRLTAMADLARILDMSEAKIQSTFESWVADLATSGQAELAFRRAVTEAQRRGKIGDTEGELKALGQALQLKPDDRPTLYYQGLILRKIQDHAAAIATFTQLVDLGEGSTPGRLEIFSNYHLGQLYDLIGQPRKATQHYRRVLENPDQYGSHEMVRKAMEERAVGGDGSDSSGG